MQISSIAFLLTALAGATAGEFPPPYNSEPNTNAAPLSAAESVARLKLPPGFQATVFAAEPDVQNPIAIAWDARGRLWVAENYTYAERQKRFDLTLRDRLLIFEDKDGDGRFDSRKVFLDDAQMLTSIEVGLGGVWLICPPRVLFVPDRDGDDTPDGPAEAVLDGFTVPPENYHNFANGLRFGPDGWLYGRCGASSPGDVGAPGTPDAQRVPMRGTMWRYHPRRKVFEALSAGCTNPWGHNWDAHGELFFINTVNGQLWHGITGAHYVRPHTIDPNPRAYALIDQHADHWHFDTARDWTKSRDGAANALGGGHAHIGMMIYLGDNWPAAYRGHLLTINMHGRRANQELLERQGSGYVGRHGEDFFISEDPWFRGMELSYGPDGGVFVADWSDTGECHDSTGVHRTSGRLYKITHGTPKRPEIGDLAKLGAWGLVKLHTHANEWFARQARLQLAGRTAAGQPLDGVADDLREMFARQADPVLKLRALWSLHAIGAADEKFLTAQLRHDNEHIRAWAIRLLTDTWPLDTVMSRRPAPVAAGLLQTDIPATTPGAGTARPRSESSVGTGRPPPGIADSLTPPTREDDGGLAPSAAAMKEFIRLAGEDKSGLVRLVLASTLQRLPVASRPALAEPLLAHAEDAADHNLPLMLWYGLIPVGDRNPTALARLGGKCELPATRRFIARRLGEDIEKNPAPLDDLLKIAIGKGEAFQSDILNGLAEALTGWRKAKAPTSWDRLQKKLASTASAALRDRVRELSVVFGDGRALDAVKRVALDNNADLTTRKTALQTLIDNRPPDLRALCEQLLGVRFLNAVAVRGLAQFDDPALGAKLAKSYRSFHPSERNAVLDTLVSRPVFASALLAEVAAGRIPRAEVSPFYAWQMRSLNDATLTRRLAEVWGESREPAADKRAFIARLKTQLTPAVLAAAGRSRGRALFNTACASCHRLHGEGGLVGPDLTGAGRDNLDYLLENIADPGAAVTADFRMSVADLKDGRVLNGVVTARTERTVTLQTMTGAVTLERAEIERLQESTLSLMPEGLLEALTESQVRDLIAYLQNPGQVPLLPAER